VELVFLKKFNEFVSIDRSHHEPKDKETWWQILGVSKNASPQDIEKAYRELSKKYHSDKGGSNEQMTKINGAIAEARKV
jgi:DnaJ-class molecular chaperone